MSFSFHRKRSELDVLEFGDCTKCGETVIFSTVRANFRRHAFDPKPTGGSEVDPVYSIHNCEGTTP